MPSKNKDPMSVSAKYKWPLLAVVILALLALFLALILQASDHQPAGNTRSAPPPVAEDIDQENLLFLSIGLTPLSNCEAVLDYYKENALEAVTPWGLGDRWYLRGHAVVEFTTENAEVAVAESSESRSDGGAADYTTTNIQVEGVDEADMVKTDGDYIYVLKNQTLKIIDIRQQGADDPPDPVAEVELDFVAADMLLSLKPEDDDDLRDTLVIVGWGEYSQLRLAQVDIDDRESPGVTADFTIDGNYVGMRLTDNVVRLVTTSQPLGLDWETPSGSGLRAEEDALEANKDIIRNSELNNWMPAYKDNLREDSGIGSLIDCSQMLAPRVFSGLNTLSIMTFNASEILEAEGWQALGLAADGREIYATADHVYVATTEVADEETADDRGAEPVPTRPGDLKTIIHKFGSDRPTEAEADEEAADTGRPVYMASGEVAGILLNQFSMDEYKGDLRVAVTVNDFSEAVQENHIIVLRPEKGVLKEIGAITGLGIDERIFAVRFMGPQGYIVTFRQIDPLYALDLSDPTDPKALGELKITGFSSYLHPVGENLLLGVGQEADESGFVEGLQISLFDTADQTDPRRVDQLLLADILDPGVTGGVETSGSSSPVERDHRAFLFHEDSAFIPYSLWWSSRNVFADRWGNEAGTLVVGIGDGSLSVEKTLKAAKVKDNGQTGRETYLEPIRTVIVDEVIYGITRNGELIAWQKSTGELLHIVPD